MAASLHFRYFHCPFSLNKLHRHRSISVLKLPQFHPQSLFPSTKLRVFSSDFGNFRTRNCTLYCSCKSNLQVDKIEVVEEIDRPAFDINIAVILAGFAFEAYTSPPDNVGRRETDAADCTTVYLSECVIAFLKLLS